MASGLFEVSVVLRVGRSGLRQARKNFKRDRFYTSLIFAVGVIRTFSGEQAAPLSAARCLLCQSGRQICRGELL